MQLYLRNKTNDPLLKIDQNNFARLVSIQQDGTFLYEFIFSSQTVKSLRQQAENVIITVEGKINKSYSTDVKENNPPIDDTSKVVKDILRKPSFDKEKSINKNARLKSTMVDLKTKISAGVSQRLKSNLSNDEVLDRQRVFQLSTTTEINRLGVTAPVLQTNRLQRGFDNTSKKNGQSVSIDMILISNIDPSEPFIRQKTFNGISRQFQGTADATSMVSRTRNDGLGLSVSSDLKQEELIHLEVGDRPSTLKAKEDLKEETKFPIIVDQPQRFVFNKGKVKIPRELVEFRDFNVRFDLLGNRGEIIESETATVRHRELVREYNTPKLPPQVFVSKARELGRNSLIIQQTDAKATSVRIYKRRLSNADLTSFESEYELVSEFGLRKGDGPYIFKDETANGSAIQYRVISVGSSGQLGFEFTNVIAPAVRQFGICTNIDPRSNAAAITAQVAGDTIKVTITNISANVSEVEILRRDRTVNERLYLRPDENSLFRAVDGLVNNVYHDRTVKEGHYYEYTCRLRMRDGSVIDSNAYAVVRYIRPNVGGVNIVVENLQITQNVLNANVSFDVTSVIEENDLDQVRSALERAGILNQFEDELQLERDKFKQLIAHRIDRVDDTTGVRETFGVISGQNFSDSIDGLRAGVSKLIPGHRYKYYISTLLRQAETMFTGFMKKETDVTTGKAYEYESGKYRHPVTLKTGTLVNKETIAAIEAGKDFVFGDIGNIRRIDVSLNNSTPRVTNVKTSRLSLPKTNVQWHLDGNSSQVDHFIVTKNILGMATVVGKVHNVSATNSFEFIDTVGSDDIGIVQYSVRPIMNTYARGESISSNNLAIKDPKAND